MASTTGEIEYLLRFVAESGCTFIRNGREYSAEKAAEHLEHKYSRVKSRIPDADTFIQRIASASSISKKPYQVQCRENRVQAGKWLEDALESFRLENRRSSTD